MFQKIILPPETESARKVMLGQCAGRIKMHYRILFGLIALNLISILVFVMKPELMTEKLFGTLGIFCGLVVVTVVSLVFENHVLRKLKSYGELPE